MAMDVVMFHPETGQESLTTREGFDSVWANLGWQERKPEEAERTEHQVALGLRETDDALAARDATVQAEGESAEAPKGSGRSRGR